MFDLYVDRVVVLALIVVPIISVAVPLFLERLRRNKVILPPKSN